MVRRNEAPAAGARAGRRRRAGHPAPRRYPTVQLASAQGEINRGERLVESQRRKRPLLFLRCTSSDTVQRSSSADCYQRARTMARNVHQSGELGWCDDSGSLWMTVPGAEGPCWSTTCPTRLPQTTTPARSMIQASSTSHATRTEVERPTSGSGAGRTAERCGPPGGAGAPRHPRRGLRARRPTGQRHLHCRRQGTAIAPFPLRPVVGPPSSGRRALSLSDRCTVSPQSGALTSG